MPPLEKDEIIRYQKLLQEDQENLLTEVEIISLIQSIDNMGDLLFNKYRKKYEK